MANPNPLSLSLTLSFTRTDFYIFIWDAQFQQLDHLTNLIAERCAESVREHWIQLRAQDVSAAQRERQKAERANKSEMSHRCKIVILWLLNILHGIFRATFSTFESHRFRKMNQTNGKYVIFRMTLSNCLFFPIIILFLVKCIDFHIPQNFIHLHNSLPIDVHRLFRRIVSPKNRWLVNSNPRI